MINIVTHNKAIQCVSHHVLSQIQEDIHPSIRPIAIEICVGRIFNKREGRAYERWQGIWFVKER
jgi:hypothetical protein